MVFYFGSNQKRKKQAGILKKQREYLKRLVQGLDKKSQHNTKKSRKQKNVYAPYAFFIIRTSTIAYK